MNGPWHYSEAERLLVYAITKVEMGSNEQLSILNQARVHAELACAAATVEARGATGEWDMALNPRAYAVASPPQAQAETQPD